MVCELVLDSSKYFLLFCCLPFVIALPFMIPSLICVTSVIKSNAFALISSFKLCFSIGFNTSLLCN